jgi:hypothetical protein
VVSKNILESFVQWQYFHAHRFQFRFHFNCFFRIFLVIVTQHKSPFSFKIVNYDTSFLLTVFFSNFQFIPTFFSCRFKFGGFDPEYLES